MQEKPPGKAEQGHTGETAQSMETSMGWQASVSEGCGHV